MRVRARFYALYRDLFGEEKTFEFPDGAKVKDLIEEIKKALPEGYPEPVVLVRGRYAEPEEPLEEEVDVVPPAAGGRSWALVKEGGDVSLDEVASKVLDEEAGAVVMFVGYVKSKGGKVKELVYEGHPSLAQFLDRIVREEVERAGALKGYVVQFLGPRKVGEKTVVIAVSAKSREEAFEAARNILERAKHEPPVWKLERRVDGEYWIAGEKEVERSAEGTGERRHVDH